MITRKCAISDGTNWIPWTQPVLTSDTSFGTITVNSVNEAGYAGFRASDGIKTGVAADYVIWATAVGIRSGWFKWVLPYSIKISQIKFYNLPSAANNYTKNAQFFADEGKTIPLGDAFVGVRSSWGLTTIPVNDVVTNTIYFYASSSYNNYIGIGEIEITAKYKP